MLEKKAELALQRAKRWLQSAERAMEDKRWDDVVYQSQMGAEQAVKGILLQIGLRFKRVHDVTDELSKLNETKFLSKKFLLKLPEIQKNLALLTEQRTNAGYGFEEELDVDEFKDAAPEALEMGKEIITAIEEELARIGSLSK